MSLEGSVAEVCFSQKMPLVEREKTPTFSKRKFLDCALGQLSEKPGGGMGLAQGILGFSVAVCVLCSHHTLFKQWALFDSLLPLTTGVSHGNRQPLGVTLMPLWCSISPETDLLTTHRLQKAPRFPCLGSVCCNAVWVSCSWDMVLLKLHFLLLLCSSPVCFAQPPTESLFPFGSPAKVYLISLKSLDRILNTSTYTEVITSALFKRKNRSWCSSLDFALPVDVNSCKWYVLEKSCFI